MIPDIFKCAVNSMCYMIMQNAWTYDHNNYDEFQGFIDEIQDDTDPEVLAFIEECFVEELSEGWSYHKYGSEVFVERMQEYIGDQYENTMFYKVFIKAYVTVRDDV